MLAGLEMPVKWLQLVHTLRKNTSLKLVFWVEIYLIIVLFFWRTLHSIKSQNQNTFCAYTRMKGEAM